MVYPIFTNRTVYNNTNKIKGCNDHNSSPRCYESISLAHAHTVWYHSVVLISISSPQVKWIYYQSKHAFWGSRNFCNCSCSHLYLHVTESIDSVLTDGHGKYTYITCATYYEIKSADNAKCSPRNDNLNLLVLSKIHWSWVRVAVLIVKTKNVDYQFILYSNKDTK